MPRKFIGLLVILLALIPLAGCFRSHNSVPSTAISTNLDKIEITAEPGVPDKTIRDAILAAKATVSFFKNNYDMELARKVKILLVKDKTSFAKAIKLDKDFLFFDTTEIAQWEANHFRAITTRNGEFIICNTGNIKDSVNTVDVIAHELVHAYTCQTANGKSEIYWLDEGTADVLAAKIVDSTGLGSFANWQENILKLTKKLPQQFPLSEITSYQAFHNAVEKNEDGAYYTSNVAVLALVDKFGYRALIDYYQCLGNTDNLAEDAFLKNFGIKLNDFQKCYNNYIASKQ